MRATPVSATVANDNDPVADDNDPVVPVDLRLALPAVAWWAGCLIAVYTGSGATRVTAVAAGAAALVATIVLRGAARRSAAAVMMCLAAAAATCGLRISADVASPAYQAAADHRIVQGEFTVAAQPARLAAQGGPPGTRVLVTGKFDSLTLDGRVTEPRMPATLFTSADGWSSVQVGERFQVTGRLGTSAAGGWPAISFTVERSPQLVATAPWWQAAANSIRLGFAARTADLVGGDGGSLLPGIVLGDKSSMPAALVEDSKITGLNHLLAVSGSHVALLVGVLLLPFRRAGPRVAAVAGAALMIGLVVMVGPSPSVLRAVVMGGIGLLALWTGRVRSMLPALAASVLGLLIFDPALAVQPGFALSVLATAAIVLVAPPWTKTLQRRGWPSGWAALLVVPTAAALATAPIITGLSGTVSLWTIPANVLVAPAVPVVLLVGAFAAVSGPVWPAVADLATRLAAPFARWIAWCTHWVAGWPSAAIPWPSTMAGVGILAVMVVAVPAVLRRHRVIRLVSVAMIAGIAVILVPMQVVSAGWPPAGWLAVGCDVGQGDGFAVATGVPGQAVVIDTGPDGSVMDRCLDRLGVSSVPLLVLTHLHADHIGGVRAVLDRGGVQAVGVGPGRDPPGAWVSVLDAADADSVPVSDLSVGAVFRAGDLLIRVLGPDRRRVPAALGPNDQSVVLMFEVGGLRMLFAGDIEEDAQRALLASGQQLAADVLKLPHHGSAKLLPEFISAVSPSIVMIGVGLDNDFGHPTEYALALVSSVGARVILRTDLEGDIATTQLDGILGTAYRGSSIATTRPRRVRPLRHPTDQRTAG